MTGSSPLETALYLVSTPIGTAADITLRGIEVLRHADVLAAEDTRTLRRLMDIHDIALNGRHIVPYHDHNGAQQRPKLLAALGKGQSIAYASDAGTPLIADPGFALARDVVAAGGIVRAAPGASAILSALVVAGLPTDRFMFAGFPPVKVAAKTTFFEELAGISATLVFYESPKRLAATLKTMTVLGADRHVAVCRELTKKFEEVLRGTLPELSALLENRDTLRGEIVIVVGPPTEKVITTTEIEDVLRDMLTTMSVKDAAQFVADQTGMPRKAVYQTALKLKAFQGDS